MSYRVWLVLDCDYLCHRAFFAMGDLAHGGEATGALFGFFRDIFQLQETFATRDFVFCFDGPGDPVREQMYPRYKSGRKERILTDQDRSARNDLKKQIKLLRRQYLPDLGYRNIFWQRGLEADDCIASACLHSFDGDYEVVIVSTDKDLYQLLSERVKIWDPRNRVMFSEQTFRKKYGISPSQWSDVKAMSGCVSDDITGIRGIGEKTACKYLSNQLKKQSKAYEKILRGHKIYEKNHTLVTLPIEGTQTFDLQQDEVTQEKWRTVMGRLGMSSLLRANPEHFQRKGLFEGIK